MNKKIRPIVGIGLTAVALTVAATGTIASSADARSAIAPQVNGGNASHLVAPNTGQSCYTNMGTDASEGINSQNFEKTYAAYDSTGAAEFTVKSTCSFTSVLAPGRYYNGKGPAKSETVTIYRAHNGAPGKALDVQTATGKDKNGSFTIPVTMITLAPGRYFVGVQANMSLVKGGQWGWEVTSQTHGATDMWQNPGGALGVCPTWTDIVTCFNSNGPDFMVSLVQ